MKITKDYVFSVIEKLGRSVAKKAEAMTPPPPATGKPKFTAVQFEQKSLSNELWRIQKKVAYGDIRPVAAMTELHALCEHSKLLVEEEWRDLLRSIAV